MRQNTEYSGIDRCPYPMNLGYIYINDMGKHHLGGPVT